MGRLRIERNNDDEGFVCTEERFVQNTHHLPFLDNHSSQTTALFLCFLVSTPLKHVIRLKSDATKGSGSNSTELLEESECAFLFIVLAAGHFSRWCTTGMSA